MDVLDRLIGHDRWTTRELLRLCAALDDESLDRQFPVGLGTLRETLWHIVRNVEVWTDLMAGDPPRPDRGRTVADLSARLDRAADALERIGRRIADRGAWDETWTDPLESPPARRSYGSTIVHIATHGMHHRCQVLYMLRRLGVDGVPEGDALSWAKHAESL